MRPEAAVTDVHRAPSDSAGSGRGREAEVDDYLEIRFDRLSVLEGRFVPPVPDGIH